MLLAILLAACSSAESGASDDGHAHDGDSGDASDGGADAGDDGGGDTGADACDHEWKGEPTACSSFSPFDRAGATWTYTGASSKQVLTRTVVESGEYAGGPAWRIDEHWELPTIDTWLTWDGQMWYRCDSNGVWLLGGTATEVETYVGGHDTTIDYTIHYTCPMLVVPPEVEVGTTWTRDYAFTRSHDDESYDYEQTTHHQVTAIETVDVPAGRFDALHVSGPNEHWLVEGVGKVQEDWQGIRWQLEAYAE